MNPHPASNPVPAWQAPALATAAPELLEFVDFKWLMAGEGHRVDLDRLQNDRAYTRGCLALAAGSTTPTLRQAAHRLARLVSPGAAPRA